MWCTGWVWNLSRVASMKKLIKSGRLQADVWHVLEVVEGQPAVVPQAGRWIVPLRVWREQRDQLLSRGQDIGVRLEPADDPAGLAQDVAHLALIAVNFPAFNDGRGYSTARLLRERHGFRGELRAVGDIFQDQLFLLMRCGFDALLLREGEDEQAAIRSLGVFSEAYQAAQDRGPLFERRFIRGVGA